MKALVTGAARGIGAAIAARLRADGLEVVTLDLAPGCDLRLDVATDELNGLEDIDVCVPNAAITNTIASSHRMTAEQWNRDLGVNLTGAFRTVQACLPGMRARGFGRVVVISSMAARSGLPGQVAYAASKAGLLGMVRTLAAEYAGQGITANAILPGMVATEVVRAMPAHVGQAITAALPTGRMVDPSEVAAAVSFLASGDAAQITGQELAIEGAWSLNTRSMTGSGRPDAA
ncbi:MAG TPA: SDR family NAD(P)-dependent oxidoreductase [Solirubrobacteraceae bacterium]|jgi:NAD(P)-dependent dehydrogenase (short-subunit alcohol dehydrogenase family)|nr:SDR family NAD(P)-dependent oxidoreductase [Solirubrobacteraceae bacterium]